MSGAAPERISLLVSDVDGTLVTNDKRLSEANARAGRALADAGVALSLVSSRPPIGFAMLREPLRLAAPLGAFNGGAILNPDFSVIAEVLVPAGAARVALEAFAAFGLDAWLFTREHWYVLDPAGAYVPKERLTIARELVELYGGELRLASCGAALATRPVPGARRTTTWT